MAAAEAKEAQERAEAEAVRRREAAVAEKAKKTEAKRRKKELAAKKRADKAASQPAPQETASAASKPSGGPGLNTQASSSKVQPVVVDLEPPSKAKKSSKKKKASKSPPKQKAASQEPSSSSEEEEDSEEGEAEAMASEVEDEEPKRKKKSKKRKRDSDSDSDVKAFIKGFAKMAKKSKKSKKKKKRSRSSSSDSSASEEEELVLIDKKVHVKDNGVDVLDMDLRHSLRTPTGEPANWWRPPFKSRVSRPIRGAGLSMEAALGPARVNDATIRRAHDRASCLTTRMLLTRNADVSIKDSKTLKVEGNTISSDRKWAPPEEVWEVVEALQNYVTLTYYIRNYSFEGLAIQRCLHDFGYFLGELRGSYGIEVNENFCVLRLCQQRKGAA